MVSLPFDACRRGIGEEGAVETLAILRDLGDLHGNIYVERPSPSRPARSRIGKFLRLEVFRRLGEPLLSRLLRRQCPR